MNKSILVFTIIAAGLLLIVHSCTKEEAQTLKSQDNKLTPYEIKVHNTIKGFIRTIEMYRENPHYKSGQLVSPDSALWLLEATINYSHGFPNEFYTGHEVEELTLVIPKTSGGMIDIAVLTQKYDEMKSNITAVYYGSSFTDKGLVLVDLEEEAQTETELILSVQTVTGERGIDPGPGTPGVNGPFVEGDDWWYGENAGKCDETLQDAYDAAQRLFYEASNTIPDPSGNYVFVGPFIEVEISGDNDEFIYPYDPLPQDNHLDRYLFFATTEYGICGDDTLCLEYPEMNIYFQRLKYLMNQYFLDNPNMSDYDIMCVLEFDDNSYQYEVNGNFYTNYFHHGKLKFGIKIYRSDIPVEL
ncbi:MAG: hypothetical protein ACNA7V_10955 [Bacteroidales bacterium]